MKVWQFSLLVFILLAGSAAWAGGGHGRYYDDDRISYSLGLNFGYPAPYWPGYGPRYGPAYGYYPRYGPYRPPYGGSIGFGYRTGYHDAFSLFFSLPLYFGPRYEPAPPAQPILVPSVKRTAQAAPRDCLQQREYQTEIMIDGNVVPAYGTACLQADGSWKIVNGPFVSD